MKPLSQMTREELWALDGTSILELAKLHKIDTTFMEYDRKRMCNFVASRPLCFVRQDLDELRIELQQSAAEARHDTQTDELTVDEEKQIRYDYVKASAKINPRD